MVPMLTCGLLRSNFAFATAVLLRTLLMRHATSGTDSFRSSGRWWMDLDPVLGRTRTRDGRGSISPTIPTVQGTDGHAVGPPRTLGYCSDHSPVALAITLLGSAANSGPRSLALPRVLIR